ncbi:MAG: hypothetical protein ABSE51_20975 [Terracidiphilus sp.]
MVASLLFLFIAGVLGMRLLRIPSLPAGYQNPSPMAKPGSALLSASEAAAYVKDYLVNPNPVQSWQPSKVDLDGLEDNLSQIPNLRENAPSSRRHIDNPDQYFRQYLAIVQSGKKQIFVNALCRNDVSHSDEWRHHLQVVIDGGDCYWQAWYDPAIQRFSNLMINGVA